MDKIHCSNPTCTKTVHLAVNKTNIDFEWHLSNVGWALQRQQFDQKPMPYCGRCKE